MFQEWNLLFLCHGITLSTWGNSYSSPHLTGLLTITGGHPVGAISEGKRPSQKSLVASLHFLEELLERIRGRIHVDPVAMFLEWRSRSSEMCVRIRGHS